MIALVTGGGGFLGSGIARALLERDWNVRTFARGDYPALRERGIETIRGDIADNSQVSSAVNGCDIVFHAAAIASSWGRYEDFFQTNVTGTDNVLDACRVHGVPKLVFTSSPSVCFHGTDQESVDESVGYPDRFLAHYPKTKALAEQRVLAANDEGLATVALRPHLIWGPGDTQLTPRIVGQGRKGQLRILGSGEQRIDATYIDNAVHAHLLAAEKLAIGAPCAGKAYYITNDEPVSVKKMINDILLAAGVAPVERHISPTLAYVAGAVFETAWRLTGRTDEPRMTRFVARQLATAHWYDISAAKRDIGYAPTVSMEAGLARLRDSFNH